MENLYIAEKPSVAKAIAAELGVTGKADGYIDCGTNRVTWCFGHMLEQAEPDDYTPEDVPRNSSGKKIWRVEELPIIPSTWILKPKKDTKKQLSIIGKLLKAAKQVINAGDPDREGQLLVDEVIEHFGYSRSILRFWVSAHDSMSLKRGLQSLKDNCSYKGWADAARARQRADWLTGMNLSRAYTLRAQRGGSRALLTVGRVQTPTLSLVVSRDREIEAFKPVPYYKIQADVTHEAGAFPASWKPKQDQEGLDSEGRLIDPLIADSIVNKLAGKQGKIEVYEQQPKKLNQPLAFALSDITLIASNKYGYSAEDVLNACQALYETHKLTSYPRTDCGYLPESQHADAPAVLEAVSHVNPELSGIIDSADTRVKSKTWNDSKITAHHGIIPTMHKGSKAALSDRERKIYDLIVRAYIAQFYPLHEYMATTVEVSVEDETFTISGKVVTHNGWKDVYQEQEQDQDDKDNTDNCKLPLMNVGDPATFSKCTRKDAKTKPPARFTEGTLTRAMENIHKYVSDPETKKLLREGDGIGTSATRASIISDLKRREYLALKGKQIISTALGRSLVDALPEVLKSPVITALYERMLKGIEQGTDDLNTFLGKQVSFIQTQVSKANTGAVKIGPTKAAVHVSTLHKCMTCGKGLSRRPGKKKGSFWWGCSGFPECKQTYPDLKGRPDYGRGRCN